ncbi:hypothetical protein T05_1386 [Trichinella murrelli]|uniref:Uncharacterized protein n=1 Tax=Trichinella murrelli TaxID=144512 RepID=A0A0V0U9V2_9BILA|nr:hypothetical protein T05_1386 [Trichinella murrelli]
MEITENAYTYAYIQQQSHHNCTIIRSSMLTFCGKQRHIGTSRKRLYVQVNALASVHALWDDVIQLMH